MKQTDMFGKRHIVYASTTTGTWPHVNRIVEIACVELSNLKPTTREFHRFVNPERAMPNSFTGRPQLTTDFLRQQPVFKEAAGQLLMFLGKSDMIMYNVKSELSFLNMELSKAGFPRIPPDKVYSASSLAHQAFPGQRNHLDKVLHNLGFPPVNPYNKKQPLSEARALAKAYPLLLKKSLRNPGKR